MRFYSTSTRNHLIVRLIVLTICLVSPGCGTQPSTTADVSTSDQPAVKTPQNADAGDSATVSPDEERNVIDIDQLLTTEDVASVVGYDQIVQVDKYKGTKKTPSRGFVAEPKARNPSELVLIVYTNFADVVAMNTNRYKEKADTFLELDNLGDGGFASERRRTRSDSDFTEYILMFHQAGHAICFSYQKHDDYTGPQTVNELDQIIKMARIVSTNLSRSE